MTFTPVKSIIIVLPLLVLCTALYGPIEVFAGRFYFYKKRTLPKVQLSEIGLSRSGVSEPLSPIDVDATWEGGTVSTPGLQLGDNYNTAEITRKNVLLWYHEYNPNNFGDDDGDDDDDDDDDDDNGNSYATPAYHVQYRILSKSGVENAFSHKSDNSSVILANITQRPIECKKKNKNNIRCYGRVDLDFDISQAKKSGKYYGTIEITIITY